MCVCACVDLRVRDKEGVGERGMLSCAQIDGGGSKEDIYIYIYIYIYIKCV